MNKLRSLTLGLSIALPAFVVAQEPRSSRLDGYVGGPYKVVATDFTGDRLVDVMLGYHAIGIVSVAQGNGRGQLSPFAINVFSGEDLHDESWSEPHVHNIAYGDIDRDGLVDLIVAVGGLSNMKRGRVVIARNRGKGEFERMLEYSVPSQAKGVRLADVDKDGRLDALYTARGSGYEDDLARGRLYIHPGLGNWKFGPAIESDAGKSAYYVETADLNNDGFVDVIVPNEHDSCVTYFLNPGRTIFSDHTALASQLVQATRIPDRRSHAINDVRAADFTGDGNQDLVTANLGTSTVSVFPGNGDGTFQKDTLLEAGKNGAFLGVGDFDRDGDTDFVITHWTEDFASVFLNRGDGSFAPREDYKTGLGNYGVDVAELNGDGFLDILTANYRARSMSILIGRGDGKFKAAVTESAALRSVEGKWVPYGR
ncbi:MAG: VCBS repeat-containing protein [Planctomycetes bacterium]|nr:VCBS repeat-containing protein [Planctomycetota bacterium]